jgi:glutathione S-transferase
MVPPPITLFIQPGFQVEGRPRCFSGTPFAIKVERCLRYKQLPFDVREVGWLERATLLPTISRSGKLPVLRYGDQLIEDSTVIAYWIEERHPEPSLVPSDSVAHAHMHVLEEWADEVLYWYGIYEAARFGGFDVQVEAYFRDLPEPVRRAVAERMRASVAENLDRQGIGRYPKEKVIADVRRGLDALAALVTAEPFVTGPTLTLADVALFGQLHRRMAGTHRWLEQEVAARPAIQTWLRRVDAMTGGAAADA